MATKKYSDWKFKANKMIKLQLCLCLAFMFALVACTGSIGNTSQYGLVVEAWHGKLLFAHRVIYAVDEHGTLLNFDISEEELGSDFEWSPDGRWIAHSYVNPNARTVSDRDIYIVQTNDSSKTIRVTDAYGPADAPTWSPDGSQIAFHAYNENFRNDSIQLLNLRCVLQGENCVSEPTALVAGINPDWSPDGKKIVYEGAYGSERRGIFVVDLENPSGIVNLSQCGSSPQWSPDGARIAFICRGTVNIADADGGNLISYSVDAFRLRWSPDGKKIAFTGTDTLDQKLGQPLDIEGSILSTAVFIMNADGTDIIRVTKSDVESIRWFTWISISKMETR